MLGLKKRFRRKFDYNKDGKVNFDDVMVLVKKSVDTDENGHVDVDELLNLVKKSIELVNAVKSGV